MPLSPHSPRTITQFRTAFLCVWFLISTYSLYSQPEDTADAFQRFGSARIDHYPPIETGLEGEIRSITALPNGVLAVLSGEQFTQFDGTRWEILPGIQRPTTTYQLSETKMLFGHALGISLVESEGGADNKFTHLTSKEDIRDTLHSPQYIAEARGHIFGCHGTLLIQIDPKGHTQLRTLANWTSSIFSIGEDVYFTGGSSGLLNRWNWETSQLDDYSHVLANSIYEWFAENTPRAKGGVWLLSENDRIVGFDGTKTWLWPGNELFAQRDSKITSFIEYSPNKLAIGTNNAGVFLFDEQGKLERIVSKNQGLFSSSIKGLGLDKQDGLWIATKRGINRLPHLSTSLLFDERHGISDSVNAIEMFNGNVYVATQSGLYVGNPDATEQENLFTLAYDIQSATDLLSYKEQLFVAGDNLIKINKNGESTELSIDGATCLWQPETHPDRILAGNHRGIIQTRFVNGSWTQAQLLDGESNEVFSFSETENGTLFGSNGGAFISRIHLSDTLGRTEKIAFNIPTQGVWTSVVSIEGKVYTNTNPCLVWEEETQQFSDNTEMRYFWGTPPFGFEHVYGYAAPNVWVALNPRRGATLPRPSLNVVGDIASVNNASDTRAAALLYDAQGQAWAGGEFGLLLAPNPHEKTEPISHLPQIHSLRSLKDNVDLTTALVPGETLYLEHFQNSLHIEIEFHNFQSAPQNLYQIYLDGLDQEWGSFLPLYHRELTNLHPGFYQFIINARNARGQSTQLIVPFVIDSPWYQKNGAKALFATLGIALLYFLFWAYNRNQIRRRKKLERLVNERTEEIANKNSVLEKQAIQLAQQNEELEEKTEKLTATTATLTSTLTELQDMQAQLVDTARTAGKAEIAINVLHNVGNVLNSLNVSVNVLIQKTETSKTLNLNRLATLVKEHQENIAHFLSTDSRGKNVPDYLIHLSNALEKEVETVRHELGIMNDDIDHVKSIIAAQQAHAKNDSIVETVYLRELCQNALNIIGKNKGETQIEISNEIPAELCVENDKHRLLDIALNLLSNGIDAINEQKPDIGVLSLHAKALSEEDKIEIRIKDNGSGIAPENQQKLFQHGFTTKPGGHGFGLHSCANTAKYLGCQLELNSKGSGLGSTAVLSIPLSIAH